MTFDPPPDGSSVLCISKQVVVTGNFNDQKKMTAGGGCTEFVKTIDWPVPCLHFSFTSFNTGVEFLSKNLHFSEESPYANVRKCTYS
jgi:hypothetical protein